MPGGKTYKVGEDVFEIPDMEVGDFLKDNPAAIEVNSFVSGKDTLDIPVNDVPDFLKDVPDAKPLKKKEPSVLPVPSSLSNTASPSMAGASDYSGKFDFLTGATIPVKEDIEDKVLDIQEHAPDLMRAATTPATTVPKDQTNYNPELQKSLYGNQAEEALGRGTAYLANSILKAPGFVYDYGVGVLNKMRAEPYRMHGEENDNQKHPIKTSSQIFDDYVPEEIKEDLNVTGQLDKAIEGSKALYNKEYDKPISEYLFGEKPDYEKGFQALGLGVLENAPTTIALMFGNASGLTAAESTALGGAVFGAGKKTTLSDRTDLTEEEKNNVALASGLTEGLGEQFGLTTLGTVAKNVFAKEGVDAAKKVATDGFVKTYGKVIARYFGVGANEVTSEMATQFAENVIDKYSGVDPELDLMTGVADAGLLALGSSVSMAGPIAVMDAAKTKQAVKKASDITAQQKELTEDLENPDVPDATKAVISNKIQDLNEQSANLATEEKKKFESLTPEGQSQVNELIATSKQISDAANDENVSEKTRDIIAKDVSEVEDAIEKVYETQKIQKEEIVPEVNNNADIKDEIDFLNSLNEEVGLDADQATRLSDLESKVVVPEISSVTEKDNAENDAVIQGIQKQIIDNKKNYWSADPGDKKAYVAYRIKNDELNQQLKEATIKAKPDVKKTEETETNAEAEVLTEAPTAKAEQPAAVVEPVEDDAVPVKVKQTQDLVDEEESAPDVKDTPEAIQKLDDEITAMKAADKKVMDAKFVGMLERAYKMKSEGKISRPTYTQFKNRVKDVYKGKKNIDAEDLKLRSTELIEKVKEKLLGQGYKNMALSSGAPLTPKTVADLLDLTNSIIHKIIDAGAGAISLAEATAKALKIVKKHPTYKKLAETKELDEVAFESELGKVKEENIDKKEKKSSQQAEVTGEQRERATNERIYDNERFKDIASEVDANLDVYDSVSQEKAIVYIEGKLAEFEKEGLLYDLAAEINTPEGAKIFPESISLMVPVILADKLNVLAEKTDNQMQRDILNKLAAKTLDVWRQKTTNIAQQLGLTGFVNKYMPKSRAGMKSRIQNELNEAQDSYLSESERKEIKVLQEEVTGIAEAPEMASKLKKMVEDEINRIAESLKGKEWVDNVNSVLEELKIDLTDC